MKLNLTKPLAIFDLETTGINIVEDRIIQIAIIKIFPDNREEKYNSLVNPLIPIPHKISAITGISDNDVKNAPTIKELAQDIINFFENCDIGGFNSIRFDIPFLVEELMRAGYEFPLSDRRFVDVFTLFCKMEPRNLASAYKLYCGKELINAHSANADVQATYEILLAQVERYYNSIYKDSNDKEYLITNNIEDLHQITYDSRNVDLAGYIVFNDNDVEVFNFGKYKGQSVEEIFKIEPSYYDWIIKGKFPIYTQRIFTRIYNRIKSDK